MRKKEKILKMSDKEQAAKDLKLINDIFKKYSLDCWLNFGALLGAIRSNDFLPWDEDIDLGYIGNEQDFYRIEGVFNNIGWKLFPKRGGIKILNSKRTSKMCIQIYSLDGKNYFREKAYYNRLGDIMDFVIWMFNLCPPEYKYERTLSIHTMRIMNRAIGMIPKPLRKIILLISTRIYDTIGCEITRMVVPKNLIEPLKHFNFKDVDMLIPNKSEVYLESMYGSDWKTPNREWKWSKG